MGGYSNPLDTAGYQATATAVDPGPQLETQQTRAASTQPMTVASGPYETQFKLMEYAQMLGTPIGTAGALVGGMVCREDACRRGMILTLAAVAGYYGWTRKDPIGWALMVSAGAAALYTLFDAPRISPAPPVVNSTA